MNVQNIMAYSNAIFKFWGRAYFLLFKYNAGLPFHYRILGIRILPSFSFITCPGSYLHLRNYMISLESLKCLLPVSSLVGTFGPFAL